MLNAPQRELASALMKGDKERSLAAIKALDNVNFMLVFNNPLRKITPLLLASRTSDKEVVQALIDKGAQADITDLKGRHALHYAQDAGKLNNAQLLVMHLPHLRTKADDSGSTPLHEAADKNKTDFLVCYLDLWIGNVHYLCDVDVKDRQEQTPLHKAVAAGHKEAAALLLQHHADPDARDKNNESPLHYAKVVSPELLPLLGKYAFPSLFSLAAIAFFKEKDKETALLQLEQRSRSGLEFSKLMERIENAFNVTDPSKDEEFLPECVRQDAVLVAYAHEKHQQEVSQKTLEVAKNRSNYLEMFRSLKI